MLHFSRVIVLSIAILLFVLSCGNDNGPTAPDNNSPHDLEGIPFVSVPGGTFQMGDETGDLIDFDRPVHTVTVSDFEMSTCEITNGQYVHYFRAMYKSGDISVNDSNVIWESGEWAGEKIAYVNYSESDIVFSGGSFSVIAGRENSPVRCVSWYAAKLYANYYGFDLPTEAEWEYACRGGKQLLYGTVDGTVDRTKANYGNSEVRHPADVGSYPANPFGLYDMCGNVVEWCHDWGGDYPAESVVNPTGAVTGESRIVRDGAWYITPVRSATRGGIDPDGKGAYLGFRVVHRPGGLIY